MKRIYHKYEDWEDYQNGMYDPSKKDENELISKAIELLSNEDELFIAMKRVSIEWKIASEHHLSNTEVNRKSWIGQAACCIVHGIPETLTRRAWNKLTKENQDKANEIASKVISEWEIDYA